MFFETINLLKGQLMLLALADSSLFVWGGGAWRVFPRLFLKTKTFGIHFVCFIPVVFVPIKPPKVFQPNQTGLRLKLDFIHAFAAWKQATGKNPKTTWKTTFSLGNHGKTMVIS